MGIYTQGVLSGGWGHGGGDPHVFIWGVCVCVRARTGLSGLLFRGGIAGQFHVCVVRGRGSGSDGAGVAGGPPTRTLPGEGVGNQDVSTRSSATLPVDGLGWLVLSA